ncbi:MAG: peptidase [Thermoanaerobaculia bacterium]
MNVLAPLLGLATLAMPASRLIFAPDIPERLRKLPATPVDYNRSLLDEREAAALKELIEASRPVGEIFLRQVSTKNPELREQLEAEARDNAAGAPGALALFRIHAGPWDRVDENAPFIGTDPKPPGAAFYPPDMTKEEFLRWLEAHPADRNAFEGLFRVIRRSPSGLTAIPYSREYWPFLEAIAPRLTKAAETTGNASLRNYLTKLSKSLLADEYHESDLAWMDIDSEIEFILGPYEVYEDQLFNYKASFTAFVTVRDRSESAKLAGYAKHLPDMERKLPIPDEHKNFNRKFESPIRVVQEVFTAGETRAGVQTAAFNLPNDERVRQAKGSKKVLLKNVMEAKYRVAGKPIAERFLEPAQLRSVTFDAFFNHTLFHELAHGLGPGVIKGPDGRKVEARILLKERYSTIEECKADVVGMWILLQAIDNGWIVSVDQTTLAVTVSALFFRSIRFGVDEAHGGGTAVQWNWFREKEAIVPAGDGRFRVVVPKFREAVRSLASELLMIEATGDLRRAERLLARYAKSTPDIEAFNARLKDIPVDIAPVYVAAGEKMP